MKENLVVHLIMDCRTIKSVAFKIKLAFNQQDPFMYQEQSILTKIRSIFPTEKIIFQYPVLDYRIDAYFLKRKLAIEVDERGRCDRNIECEIERQKAIEKELNCKFKGINPAKEKLDFFLKLVGYKLSLLNQAKSL